MLNVRLDSRMKFIFCGVAEMTCKKCGNKSDSSRTCSSCGHDNFLPETSEKRTKWFTVFLCLMIALTIFFIINNTVIIMTTDEADGLSERIKWFVMFKIILYGAEILLYILLFRGFAG